MGPTHPRGPGAVVFAKVVEEGEGEGEGGVEEEVVGVVEEVVAVLPKLIRPKCAYHLHKGNTV